MIGIHSFIHELTRICRADRADDVGVAGWSVPHSNQTINVIRRSTLYFCQAIRIIIHLGEEKPDESFFLLFSFFGITQFLLECNI
jgi:hypothetical protein